MSDPDDGEPAAAGGGPDPVVVVDTTEAEWLGMAERARGYLRALGDAAEE